MSKHKPQIHDLGSIINFIDVHARDSQWYHVMEIEIPGLDEANETGEAEDWAKASQIEADYINAHHNDRYEVRWPDLVTVPRFNSDATYCLIDSE